MPSSSTEPSKTGEPQGHGPDRDLADDFRLAMRQLAGGVCAISVGSGATRGGLVATSVTSLSVHPPTLLVCINRRASCWPLVERFRRFCVNILAHRHLDLARRFAGQGGEVGEERFAGGTWVTAATGAPVLAGALAAIECEVEELLECHSHNIVVGRVTAVAHGNPEDALVYLRGSYASLRTD